MCLQVCVNLRTGYWLVSGETLQEVTVELRLTVREKDPVDFRGKSLLGRRQVQRSWGKRSQPDLVKAGKGTCVSNPW